MPLLSTLPLAAGPRLSAVLVAFALAAPSAEAQVLYGSIVGNVKDSTGAAVPGATVDDRQTETKLTRELVTDAAGAYTSPRCHPGPTR